MGPWIWGVLIGILTQVNGASLILPSFAATPHSTEAPAIEAPEGLMNKLLAPGPLIEAHRELEQSRCLECHEPRKGVPDSHCLNCHTAIASQIKNKAGFHGLSSQTCIQCHTDHQGREFNNAVVDPKAFDHASTSFLLKGKHSTLRCTDCHQETREKTFKTPSIPRPHDPHYFGLKSSCVSCHSKDDIHHFRDPWAKKDCDTCHGVENWKQDLRFDHLKETHYALNGKHGQLRCTECHQTKDTHEPIYHWPNFKKSECLTCHRDQHQGQFSNRFQGGHQCLQCHTETSWKIPHFDHSITGYVLRGKHSQLQCIECHRQGTHSSDLPLGSFQFKGLQNSCVSCHRDHHLFGSYQSKKWNSLQQCQTCHNDVSWKNAQNFNHNQDTSFPLGGKHLTLDCNQCHIPAQKEGQPKVGIYHWKHLPQQGCAVCHTSPHLKTFSSEFLKKKCTECHTDRSWKEIIGKSSAHGFDHSKTRFALTGKHEGLACVECHRVQGKEVYHFDHANQKFCLACHANPHQDQFSQAQKGESCSQCHTTMNFTDKLPFDHSKTNYPLKGAHQKIACQKCHIPTSATFPLPPHHPKMKYAFPEIQQKDCAACHKDAHRGAYGKQCSQCHEEGGWNQGNAKFHQNFTLEGVHFTLRCDECHLNRPKLAGTSQMCGSCHQKDDIHRGALPNCGECHKQTYWEHPEFQHSLTNFPLTGAHRVANCSECHANNVYKGASTACVSCHLQDALSFTGTPNHRLFNSNNCQDCHHNTFSFR